MARFMSPEYKHLNVLSIILVYFVLLLCCHASCVLVNVTRDQQDIFSYPGISSRHCSQFCMKKNSAPHQTIKLAKKYGICICKCLYDYSTFVTAELKCVQDKVLRMNQLDFWLYKYEQPNGHLKILTFDSRATTIMFQIVPPNKFDHARCKLNNIEELRLENFQEWESVEKYVSNHSIKELDDDDIAKDYWWIPMEYEGWMMLTLNWAVNSNRFVGRIMRINVTCSNSNKSTYLTGVMVFKVNGTFKVPDDSMTSSTSTVSTSYQPTPYLTPTPSTTIKTTVFVNSTTSRLLSTMMTLSSLQPMTSSLKPMTSLLKPMTSSLEPMTSSSLRPMMSSTASPSILKMSTESLKHSLTTSSIVASSSMAVSPAKKSKSSSTAAVTGGVIAGIVVLLLAVVILVYVLRKRRKAVMMRKHSDLGHINPASASSLTSLPTMSNPLNDGVYENPEVVNDGTNRRSGVMSIDSAMYDACLVVENPSARETKSVYDNIPEPTENTYKALDPAKREPSAKYQSLITDEHEYSTVADLISGASIQEPLYSEVEGGPYINGGRNAPTPPPFSQRKTHSSAAAEPIYNELEGSDDHSTEGVKRLTPEENASPLPPPLEPRKTRSSATTEPIYNELEGSDNHSKEGVKRLTPEENASPLPPPLEPRKTRSSATTEPIYNELEGSDDHSKEGVKRLTPEENASPLPPPLAPRKTNSSATVEPIYNELEGSDNFSKGGVECPTPEENVNPTPPTQPPRNPRVSTSHERMNGVESGDNHTSEGEKPEENDTSTPSCQTPQDLSTPDGNQNEDENVNETANGLVESIDDENVNGIGNGLEESIDGQNGPVYSVLEEI